ncbi:MAG: ATP-dependent Clp protease adapter ClpS [Oceanococcaceae bacterium]
MSDAQDNTPQRGAPDQGLVLEVERPKLAPPPMYQVIVLNDDYTPMEFVVHVLQKFFRLPHEAAVQLMMEVHTQGKAAAGTFTAEIAETKVSQVNKYARDHQHPLLSTMERV